MVMVITFLTLTNIAIGYGLAVYVHKHFGTLMYRRGAKAVAEVASPVAAPAVIVTETAPAPDAAATPTAAPVTESVVAEAPAPPAPQEITAEAEPETAESDTVDEENVLAGIEEFRSQLAKMSESSETAEQFVDESQQELVGAAN
jgi:hypothetical protein